MRVQKFQIFVRDIVALPHFFAFLILFAAVPQWLKLSTRELGHAAIQASQPPRALARASCFAANIWVDSGKPTDQAQVQTIASVFEGVDSILRI